MGKSFPNFLKDVKNKAILFDVFALTVIIFLPDISRLLGFQLYIIEPIRLLLVLAIAHTTKQNALILSIVLPITSYILSSHPVVSTMLLMISEMLINVWLFFYLSKRIGNIFYAAVGSIAAAKIYYYPVKYLLIYSGQIDGELIAAPIYIQLILLFVFSWYLHLMLRKNRRSK
jgi:hypothetical protein